MATDAELTAAGFKLPLGGDYMNEGDNAIRDNASAAYDFARRFKVDFSGSPLGSSDSLATLPLGYRVHTVWSGAVATALGLPTATPGTVISSRFGTLSGTQMWFPRVTVGEQEWQRTERSNGWGEWNRVDAGVIENVSMLRPAAPGSLKTAPLALTLGYGGAQTTGTGTTVVIQNMPKTARRVQLHLANRNPRYAMADSADVAITAAAIGLHNGSGGSASWTTLPGTGPTAYDSGWVEVPEAWRGKDIAVRYTWSSAGAVQRNIGTGWTNGAKDNTPPLFAWLEVEVPASTPVIAAFGDSLSSGVSSARPVVDSWIDQYARQIGAVPAHWSASGDKASGWQGSVERKWFMYGEAIAMPDAMVYFMGSNDLSEASITAGEMQARLSETAAAIQARITPVLFGATILPRNDQATGSTFETVRRQVNAWLPASGLFRQVFAFSAAISSDDDTIIPAYNADGTHLTSAGYGALAAAITRPLVTPQPPSADYSVDVPLTDQWRTDVSSEVTAYRSGNVVTVSSWRLAVNAGVTGPVIAYTLPAGYRPIGLTQQYIKDGRGADTVMNYTGQVTITNPSSSVTHHSFTFITGDAQPST